MIGQFASAFPVPRALLGPRLIGALWPRFLVSDKDKALRVLQKGAITAKGNHLWRGQPRPNGT